MYRVEEEEVQEEVEDVTIEVSPDVNAKKAQRYAKEHPELAADLIKAWMKD